VDKEGGKERQGGKGRGKKGKEGRGM